jgi:aryl-alcohol dehydrogenase-like predicted oxidoreductase
MAVTERLFSTIDLLQSYAQGRAKTDLATLIYAWLYHKAPIDSFLVGARSERQFRAVTDALDVRLAESDWQELEQLLADAHWSPGVS